MSERKGRKEKGRPLGGRFERCVGHLQRALHCFSAEALDDVALLDVLVIFEGHTAFLTHLYFANLVLEALERRQLALVNYHVVANEANASATLHLAFRHAATRNLADL